MPVKPVSTAVQSTGSARERPSAQRRLQGVTAALLLLLALLSARLIGLQFVSFEQFRHLARQQHVHTEVLASRPGNILDRHGKVLATSVEVQSLYADPAMVENPWQVALALSEPLSADADELFEKLTGRQGRRFVWLRRRLSPEELEAIRALKLESAGVGFRSEFRRLYPQGRLAAHVLGFRDADGAGQGGVEGYFDAQLRGWDGRQRLLRDAQGRNVALLSEQSYAAEAGRSLVLTLDTVIQTYVERALDALMAQWNPAGACAVVVDPRDGEVLAMASRPTFDPNEMQVVQADAWRNRAIVDAYEPGSTLKPLVLARALDTGRVKPGETLFCENGVYRMGNRLLHDHHPYGLLSLADVIVRSSNIGMAKIGQRLGNEALYGALVDFGLGRPTEIELPGEASGTVLPLEQWTSYSTGSVPMGQEVAVTPLQLLVAYAALANGGKLLRPTLVGRAEGAEGWWLSHDRSAVGFDRGPSTRAISGSAYRRSTTDPYQRGQGSIEQRRAYAAAIPRASYEAPAPQQFEPDGVRAGDGDSVGRVVGYPVQPQTAQWLLDPVLRDVVESARGTGRRARLEGYEVFGKSGTAQKADSAAGGYSHQHHVSSFLLGGPLREPRALVLVMVDEPAAGAPQFGGQVAAPAAAEILKRTLVYLRVAADR